MRHSTKLVLLLPENLNDPLEEQTTGPNTESKIMSSRICKLQTEFSISFLIEHELKCGYFNFLVLNTTLRVHMP